MRFNWTIEDISTTGDSAGSVFDVTVRVTARYHNHAEAQSVASRAALWAVDGRTLAVVDDKGDTLANVSGTIEASTEQQRIDELENLVESLQIDLLEQRGKAVAYKEAADQATARELAALRAWAKLAERVMHPVHTIEER